MRRKLTAVAFLAVALALPAFAQTFGEINGVVTDSTSSVIVGAKVTVTNPLTNFTRTTVSNNAGYYSFPALPPGLYNVRAEDQGFQSEVHNSIELQVQQSARIDFQLNVGSVAEAVEVSGGVPLLNTENATIGTVIEQRRIEDLPLNGRSFIGLLALSPNVITGQTSNSGFSSQRGGGDRQGISVAIAGLRRQMIYFTLDGISNTDIDWNTYAFLPSLDALQEFKIQTGTYSTEFGREAAQINVSTKSGTNQYHGALFEFLRNNDLDARPYGFTTKVPTSAPFKWNQYGFSLGGPVQVPKLFDGKNRLFFMSNYEGFKLRNQAQQLFSVPSAAMRQGDFSEILKTTVIKDPTNNNLPFAGNIISAQRLDPIAKGLLEFYPLPNMPGAGLVNNYLALQNKTTDKDQFSQRIDFVESAKSNWFGRYSWQDESGVSPNLYLNGTAVGTKVKQAVISNTRIFSPTLVNEFRTGYLGFHNLLSTELANKRDVIKELNIPLYFDPPPAAWGTPNITITGFSGFGDTSQGPWEADDHTFQWIDNLSWNRGTHSLKFGVEIRRDRYNGFGNQQTRGQFAIQNQATGYGFSDYMLGYIQQTGSAAGLANAQLRATSQFYYVTDTWKLRSNLTVEAGLRYEYTAPWSSRGDSMLDMIFPQIITTPNAPTSVHPYFARDCGAYGQNGFYPPENLIRIDLAVQVKCVSGQGSTFVPPDKTNFAPRLGIAWSPSPKWTIRAGAGIFYAQDINNTYLDMARNFAGNTADNATLTIHNLTFEHPFTVNAGSSACGVSSPPYICFTNPGPIAVHLDRTPRITQYTLNIQRQLDKSTVLEIGYLGSQGHHLPRQLLLNVAVPSATGSIASRLPYPELASIQYYTSIVNSSYHSGSVKLTRQFSNGLSLLAGYTFSKSLDDGSSSRPDNASVVTQPQIGWCARCEYGLSDFDSRQRLVVSALYELPVGKGKRFLNHGIVSNILGGWQLNSIISNSTGFPITAIDGVAQSNTNATKDRPNAVNGVNPKLDNPTPSQWFNTQAFVLQPFGTFGNVARNTLTSPGVSSWDFSTFKNFVFTERSYLQFRFECFNCANHPNFADPGNSMASNQRNAAGFVIPGTGNFGVITATRPGIDMRELQFSLKLIF